MMANALRSTRLIPFPGSKKPCISGNPTDATTELSFSEVRSPRRHVRRRQSNVVFNWSTSGTIPTFDLPDTDAIASANRVRITSAYKIIDGMISRHQADEFEFELPILDPSMDKENLINGYKHPKVPQTVPPLTYSELFDFKIELIEEEEEDV